MSHECCKFPGPFPALVLRFCFELIRISFTSRECEFLGLVRRHDDRHPGFHSIFPNGASSFVCLPSIFVQYTKSLPIIAQYRLFHLENFPLAFLFKRYPCFRWDRSISQFFFSSPSVLRNGSLMRLCRKRCCWCVLSLSLSIIQQQQQKNGD